MSISSGFSLLQVSAAGAGGAGAGSLNDCVQQLWTEISSVSPCPVGDLRSRIEAAQGEFGLSRKDLLSCVVEYARDQVGDEDAEDISDAMCVAGHAFRDQNMLDVAKDLYEQAMCLDDDEGCAFYAHTCCLLGASNEAIAALNPSLSETSTSFDAWWVFAHICYQKKNNAMSVPNDDWRLLRSELMNAYCKMDSEDRAYSRCYYYLARLYFSTGQYDHAWQLLNHDKVMRDMPAYLRAVMMIDGLGCPQKRDEGQALLNRCIEETEERLAANLVARFSEEQELYSRYRHRCESGLEK